MGKIRHEVKDYRIEFDGDKPVDVNDLQAAMIIKQVLYALDVDFDEIKVKQFIKHVYEATEGGTTTEFIGEEPENWYVEADLRERMLEVGIDDCRMRIPLATILAWFAKGREDMR